MCTPSDIIRWDEQSDVKGSLSGDTETDPPSPATVPETLPQKEERPYMGPPAFDPRKDR